MRMLTGIILAVLFAYTPIVHAAELVMFTSPGCEWCEAWENEVGIIYNKTDEARVAPLRRLDIDAPRPGSLSTIRPVMYTPTFVVMDGDSEIGRIAGYPGEAFFWGMLSEMISRSENSISGCATSQVATLSADTGGKC